MTTQSTRLQHLIDQKVRVFYAATDGGIAYLPAAILRISDSYLTDLKIFDPLGIELWEDIPFGRHSNADDGCYWTFLEEKNLKNNRFTKINSGISPKKQKIRKNATSKNVWTCRYVYHICDQMSMLIGGEHMLLQPDEQILIMKRKW